MNALWITHPESDYGASMMLDGFMASEVGVRTIDFFPHKWQYLGHTHHYELPHALNGCTAPAPWMEPFPYELNGCNYGVDSQRSPGDVGYADMLWTDVVSDRLRANHYDLIVIESQRMCCIEALSLINLSHWVVKHRIPVVVIDSEDSLDMRRTIGNLRIDVFLKREYTHHIDSRTEVLMGMGSDSTLVLACPFSITERMREACDAVSTYEDSYDALLACGNTFPIRVEVADALRASEPDIRVGVHINAGAHNGTLPWNDYIAVARSARISVCPRGFGLDTVRMWEHACATALSIQRTHLLMPHQFTHGINALYWGTAQECIDVAKQVAASKAFADDIRAAGIEHAKAHHMSKHRALAMIEAVQRISVAKNLRSFQ